MELVLTLLIVGAILLLLETVLPGMVAGIVGFACLTGAVVAGYMEFGAQGGTLTLLGVSVGLVIGTLLWMKYFPLSPLGRLFVSQKVVGDIGTEKPELLNQTGTAFTQLRPSGTALIGGKRVDVVTEGPLIERGTGVKVVAVEGMRVVVRALETTTGGVQELKPIKT